MYNVNKHVTSNISKLNKMSVKTWTIPRATSNIVNKRLSIIKYKVSFTLYVHSFRVINLFNTGI